MVHAPRLGRLALGAALLLGLSRVGAAQSAPDRLALERTLDSLDSVHDTVALTRAYRSLTADRGRDHGTPELQLRLGVIALRLSEMGAKGRMADAVGTLERVASSCPDWPAAWYLLGLAEAVRADREQADRLALGSRVGIGRLERAAERQRRALAVDPGYIPAALALTSLTLNLRDTSRFAEARDALRKSVDASRAPSVDLLLAWGRLERAAGNLEAADTAFGRYLAAGGNRGLGLLELARTELAGGPDTAESLYFEGAALDDPTSVAGYRADLVPIALEAELARFDRLSGAARADYLRRFWTDRDRYAMRADGERIREHYRRLLHARRDFALTVSRRYYGAADAYRSGSEELDDRGVIYVRHGEPAERLRPFVYGLMPNETWRYDRAEGDLLFHFSSGYDDNGGGDLYDYRLVESVNDLRGAADAPVDQLLLSRQSMSPLYGRMLNWGPYGRARSEARERGIGQASIAIGTTSDSYELRFDKPLAAVADLIAVGTRAGGSLAHLVFAVAAPGAEAVKGEDGVRYITRVRGVALSADGMAPVSLDTTIVVRAPRPLREDEYMVGRAEMALPAGHWSWRAALAQGNSSGVVLAGDSLRVGSQGNLELSDLAMGAAGMSATWQPTPADTVLLTPFDLFRAGGEVGLYYEAGGAEPSASYRHEIAVFRMKGDPARPERRPAVSLAFEEPARETTLRSHRTLQLGRLRPGRYLVEVRVSGPDGATSTRRREIQVVKGR
jgi:GWxTD domain-containing protein